MAERILVSNKIIKKNKNKNTHKLPIVVKLNLYYATFNKSKMNYSTFTVKL